MENSDANHLPEVDSLPDGFFESSAEPLGPATPVLGQEKTKPDHNEDNDLKNDSEPEPSITQGKSEPKSEKIHKMRNFPVILTEKDNSDSSGPSPKVPSDGCLGDTNDSLSGASTRVKNELPSKFSNEKGKVEVKHENSEKSITGDLESQGVRPKGISSSDSTEASKNRKAGASEVKCKTAKHGFKSEKEFLEFTLKYQKVIAEKDSAIAVRDRLESLCRELQRQNKMLMEECKRVSTEGKDLRYDLSTKFHEAIKDVNSRLEEQKNESLSQFKENEILRSKLKEFSEQYTLCEEQFTQKLKQKSLELQIAELKIQHHEEKIVQEQSQMKLYAQQVSQLLATEKNLRLQLTADGEKFQQFQV